MSEKKKTGFYSLFNDNVSKGEVISTFQALLRLMSKQVVFAEQEKNEEIQLTLNPEYENVEINFEALGIDVEEDGEEDISAKLG